MQSDHQVEIIGAGWGRTGTTSLKAALEILGYPTYHMVENIRNHQSGFWIAVAKKEKVDFNDCFALPHVKFTATCDYPSAKFWREQLKQYPNAKVILTIRDADSWYKSCINTIFKTLSAFPSCTFAMKLSMWLGFPSPRFGEMVDLICTELSFNNDISEVNIKKSFNDHNDAVIRECPPEKLLVFEAKQGWAPLCKFLGKPIPDVPYPSLNNTDDFQTHLNRMEWMAYGCMAAGVAVLAIVPAAVMYLRK